MKIETTPLPDGGIRVEIGGESEEMPPHIAAAFISKMVHQMQKAAPNFPLQGGAVLHPDNVSINPDAKTGALHLFLTMGPVHFRVALPPGLLEQIAKDVLKI